MKDAEKKKKTTTTPAADRGDEQRAAMDRGDAAHSVANSEAGGTTYFLTFSARTGMFFDRSERALVLESVRWGHPKMWVLHGAVVMPDHAQMLLTPVGYSSSGVAAPPIGAGGAPTPLSPPAFP
jgi:hypothetical protein